MKGDFTRFTFRPDKRYTGVHLQQGRILLDADWNEQIDIDFYQRQAVTAAYVGTYGTPQVGSGFLIGQGTGLDLTISPGRFYVSGLLCELFPDPQGGGTTYLTQSQLPSPPVLSTLGAGAYLVYLDVWTRHVTLLEDPLLREVALNGPDTTTRTQTMWQVKLLPVTTLPPASSRIDMATYLPAPTLQLTAHAVGGDGKPNDATLPQGTGYQRVDNCLYRVEIHQGGRVGTDPVTYKWSRDNGSVVAAWTAQNGNALTIAYPGRDDDLGFAIGSWIELCDDTHELQGLPGQLVRVINVEGDVLTVDPSVAVDLASYPSNPKIRRWDMTSAAIPQVSTSGWLPLESGVEICFGTAGATCQTGDYWVIPARAATRNVEWPQVGGQPAAQPRLGVAHSYAPLAQLQFDGSHISNLTDLRVVFPSATDVTNLVRSHAHTGGGDGTPIPRAGIIDGAIDGSKIDPSAQVTVQALNATDHLEVNNATSRGSAPAGARRAMYHGSGDQLHLNYLRDYTGGVAVDGPLKVAYASDLFENGSTSEPILNVSGPSTVTTIGGLGVQILGNMIGQPYCLVVTGPTNMCYPLTITATQLCLDNASARGGREGDLRRALVHDNTDALVLNQAGDYSSGVQVAGQLTLGGRTFLNENLIYLRNQFEGDHGHGLGYFGPNRPFAGVSVDGPVLFGHTGGALGTVNLPAGGVEGALLLNQSGSGSPGYVNLPNIPGSKRFSIGLSIEAWVYFSSLSNANACILDLGAGVASDNIILAQDGNSTNLRLTVYYGSTANSCVTAPQSVPVLSTGVWIHIAVTVNTSANTTIYQNGQSVPITGGIMGIHEVLRNSNFLGKSNANPSASFPGKLAQVRLWTRVLTANEIADHYNGQRPVNSSGLVAYWPLDDGTGTRARDRSGHGFDGTLSASNATFETYQSAALSWNSAKNLVTGNDLTVTGNLNPSSSLTIGGALTANSTLLVNGAATLSGGLTVNGSASLRNNLSVSGTSQLSGTLSVSGDTTLGGNLIMSAGTANLNTLSVPGYSTLGGTLTANGTAIFSNTVTINGVTNLNNTLNVSAPAALNSGVTVTGNTSLSNATVGGTLTMTAGTVNVDSLSARGSRPGSSRRALLHDTNDLLTLNPNGDYSSGVQASGQLLINGRAYLYDNQMYLRTTGGAHNNGLGYFGSQRPFGGAVVDGPGLYGASGGVLGIARAQAPEVVGSVCLPGYINNVGSYVSLSSLPATLDFSAGFSVVAWVYLTSLSSKNGRIIELNNSATAASDSIFFTQDNNTTNLRFTVYLGATQKFTAVTAPVSGTVLSTGTWLHVAATLDGSGAVAIYLNGTAVTVQITGTVAVPAKTLRAYNFLGKTNFAQDGYLQGKLAQVRLWNRGITAFEVYDLFNCQRPANPTNQIAYWPLDDGTGSAARDLSANNFAATLSPTNAVFETYQAAALSWDANQNVVTGNNLTVAGNATLSGGTLLLDNAMSRGDRPGSSRRALLHDAYDALTINAAGDYSSGVQIAGQVTMFGRINLNDNGLYLRGAGDHNHGIGYFGAYRPFNGSVVDGPVLYGYTGGVLGTIHVPMTGIEASLVLPKSGSTNGYVDLSYGSTNSIPASVDFSAGFSVEAWVYFSSLASSNARIIDLGTSSTGAGDNIIFGQDASNANLRFTVYTGTTQTFTCVTTSGTVLSTNTWLHLAATVDGSGNVSIYRNGVAQASSSTGTVVPPANKLRTSLLLSKSNLGTDGYLQGKLAHVRLWNRVITANECLDRRYDARPVNPAGLIGYWPLDDGAGSIARDMSGNGRKGAVFNSAFESYQAAALTWDANQSVAVGNNLSVGGRLSSGNFKGAASATNAVSSTGTMSDMPGMVVSVQTVNPNTWLLILFSASSLTVQTAQSGKVAFNLLVDSTVAYQSAEAWVSGAPPRDISFHSLVQVASPGSHTVKIQWSGNTLVTCNTDAGSQRILSVVELG